MKTFIGFLIAVLRVMGICWNYFYIIIANKDKLLELSQQKPTPSNAIVNNKNRTAPIYFDADSGQTASSTFDRTSQMSQILLRTVLIIQPLETAGYLVNRPAEQRNKRKWRREKMADLRKDTGASVRLIMLVRNETENDALIR